MDGLKNTIIAVALMLVLFASGCAEKSADNNSAPEPAPVQSDAQTQAIISKCENLCEQNANENNSIASGPCLSNEIAPDWVCDIAHSPRQAIDDLPENQCLMYRGGAAHHFVEVDENCEVIRTI